MLLRLCSSETPVAFPNFCFEWRDSVEMTRWSLLTTNVHTETSSRCLMQVWLFSSSIFLLAEKIVGFTREEKLEVPAEALREALTNALCHRQFHNTSSSVGIAIYDDRVEIENTGHLPDELTVETIKQSHHSFPQNPTIADVLFKTTFLENWGSGVGRMLDACREANLPEPEFHQNAAFVWVTFKRTTIEAYNPSTPQPHKFTLQPLNLKRK